MNEYVMLVLSHQAMGGEVSCGDELDNRYLVLDEVAGERWEQDQKWGEQNHPDGTKWQFIGLAQMAQEECRKRVAEGTLTWRNILLEEVYEAFGETESEERLRHELIQVAAVAVAWIEAIDRRTK